MASMHAPAGRAIRWMLVIVIAVTLGCRGSRPFNRYVQVTKTSDPDLPSIEAPAQRLATAKPRNGEDATSPHQSARSPSTAAVNAETALDRGPNASEAVAIEAASSNVPQDRTATSRTSTPATAVSTRLTSNSSPTVGAKSSDRQPASASGEAPSAGNHSRPSVSSTGQSTDSTAKSPLPGLPPTAKIGDDVTSDELLAALQDFPPELRQQALRQFVAAAARSADQTNQPNTLAAEACQESSRFAIASRRKDDRLRYFAATDCVRRPRATKPMYAYSERHDRGFQIESDRPEQSPR